MKSTTQGEYYNMRSDLNKRLHNLEYKTSQMNECDSGEKVADCVICERHLHKAPTSLYWCGVGRFGQGVCYECILSLLGNVIMGVLNEERGE